jgi:transcription termination factor Rho
VAFGASLDAQSQAVEGVVEQARRLVARGCHVVVLIDTLSGVHEATARKALGSARAIPGGGSLTVIATAARPVGAETTVFLLDPGRARAGQFPALDAGASWTMRADALVG